MGMTKIIRRNTSPEMMLPIYAPGSSVRFGLFYCVVVVLSFFKVPNESNVECVGILSAVDTCISVCIVFCLLKAIRSS